MGCVMTAVMLAFMWHMYRPQLAKIPGPTLSIAGGMALLAVNRSQALIGDEDFMKGMIPHHSIANNNAVRADIRDARVRYLADRITRDQVKEIAQMKMLLRDIDAHGRRASLPLDARGTSLTPESRAEARRLLSGALLDEEPL